MDFEDVKQWSAPTGRADGTLGYRDTGSFHRNMATSVEERAVWIYLAAVSLSSFG